MADEFAGYDSIDDLVKAYRSSSEEGKRQRQRADAAETAARNLLEQQNQFTRQAVPQRADPASRLAEYGVPVDALGEFVRSAVNETFEPIARGAMARNSMLSKNPDYQKYEADVAQFINEDPGLSQSYQKLFGADPVAAMEFAFLKFGETKRREHANGDSTPQQTARSEAQIPSSRSGDARTQPAAQADEQLNRTWDHYQKTGDPRAFAKARLSQAISNDFLNK